MSDTLVKLRLSLLEQSQENVRKTDRAADVAALAASIKAHGLLQNLTVRETSSNGKEKRYQVIAGGRRLQALNLLAKRRKIDKDYLVPCRILKNGSASNVEVSLAENVARTSLHPADQFEAFLQLRDGGLGAAEIAARFGVTTAVVEQRLKLATVSPRLMEVYKSGEMTLDQLTAFTITDDHAAQEHVWFEAPLFDRGAAAIRRALTKALVAGSDRRARFVGASAYEKAGGVIIRDLFDLEASYFVDSQLLDRLVAEKLRSEQATIEKEGWSWTEVRLELDYEELSRFGRVSPRELKPSRSEERRLKSLGKRYDDIVAELEEKEDSQKSADLDQIEADIAAVSEKRMQWSKKDKVRSGTIISVDPQGRIRVVRGLVREQSRRNGANPEPSGDASDEKPNGLSEALVRALSAHRTAGLREALAGQPHVALTALLYSLSLVTFFEVEETCLNIRSSVIDLGPHAEGIRESSCVIASAERRRKWSERMPDQQQLWVWITQQNQETRLELLAYLVSQTANAIQLRLDRSTSARLQQAEQIAQATSLDMSKWWRVTRDSYLDRVSKQLVMEAVSEGISSAAAQDIAHLKKSQMAARAESLLKESNWLPSMLRTKREHSTSRQ